MTYTTTILGYWTPASDDEIQLCSVWLADRDAEDFAERSSYSLKHEVEADTEPPTHIPHSAMITALLADDDWPVREDEEYLIVDC